ncbi:response regulator [Christiangramia echinicola]|uniref:response regulator n=1 Tax=Christiangramia echinicola TaxID=279359 RepID=UPI0004059AE5|nr:response regulator [Christiangramia echinicola]
MTFFLIDDDQVFHFITSKTLKKINPDIIVEKFLDGEEGINRIKNSLHKQSELPDIVLLDINMPYLNGWGFLKEFQTIGDQIEKEVQIYMLTSSDDPEDLEKAKKFSELSGYIVKPVSKEELEVLIRNFPSIEWFQPNL